MAATMLPISYGKLCDADLITEYVVSSVKIIR